MSVISSIFMSANTIVHVFFSAFVLFFSFQFLLSFSLDQCELNEIYNSFFL